MVAAPSREVIEDGAAGFLLPDDEEKWPDVIGGRLRELGVIVLTPAAGCGSQVIVPHGLTSPCVAFRRSENTQESTVLGRVGQ